jgi:hypothetical protein
MASAFNAPSFAWLNNGADQVSLFVIILLEILHCFKFPNIVLLLLQHPHKVSLLLRQIVLVPLVYLVCLSNHIWMHVAQVCFLPGKYADDFG